MIDANTLLNPEFQDSELRAYAYLSTQFKKGVRSPLDCLQPFVIYAIAAQDGSQLIWDELRVFLKNRYGLRIPFYMIQRMEGSLLALGAVEKTEIPRVLVCKDVRPKIANKSVDFSVQEIGHAEIALEKFAEKRGVPKPQTAASWRDILVPFFLHRAPPQDKAVSNINGVMVSDPKGFDFSLIADFIVEEFHKKSQIYKVIEQIYYGALISDFLTQMEQAGSGAEFKGLGIIYDAPVILRMLGCSGKVLKEATIELHETLRDLGCRVYYFSHTYDETSEAIEAMLKCYENKQPMFRETQEAISRGEITIAELY